MRKFVALFLLFLSSALILEVVTQSPKKNQALSKTCSPSSTTCNTKENQINKPRPRKLTRKEKCCLLGRKMAKIGDSCTYASSLASIKPDFRHFHKMKTSLWINSGRPVIRGKLLRKCKRFKAFYEKCCLYESEMIERDIKRMIKRLRNFLKKRRLGGKKRMKKSKEKALDLPRRKTVLRNKATSI